MDGSRGSGLEYLHRTVGCVSQVHYIIYISVLLCQHCYRLQESVSIMLCWHWNHSKAVWLCWSVEGVDDEG